jgi:hypothetical protein
MTTVALTGFVRVGAGTWPDLSRHALGAINNNVIVTYLCPLKNAPLVVHQPVEGGLPQRRWG